MNLLKLIFTFAAAVLAASCSEKEPINYGIEVIAEYPHDTESYTQGLFFYDGNMYESTGLKGKSTFRQVELQTGRPILKMDFDKQYFIEGSTVFNGKLYILTWESRLAFVYDAATLEYESTWNYPREGWGLTTDGSQLIASDGSSSLYFMDGNFELKKKLTVKYQGRPVRFLNELEYIDGKIWANIYTTDEIAIINSRNGKVEGVIDCKGLLPKRLRTSQTDVLNGIAINPDNGKIYLTGKNWPRLYEVRLKEKRKR